MYQDNHIQKHLSDLSIRVPEIRNLAKHQLLDQLINENPHLRMILNSSDNVIRFTRRLREWVESWLRERTEAWGYYQQSKSGRDVYMALSWQEIAAIRILDYLDHSGKAFTDQNLNGQKVMNHPFKILYNDYQRKDTGSTKDFYFDMIALFRQYSGTLKREKHGKERLDEWMARHPSGLDKNIIKQRHANKQRIIKKIIVKLESGELKKRNFSLDASLSHTEKLEQVEQWWKTSRFHLAFAFRSPELINEMLDNTLDEKTLQIMDKAKAAGIPFFVNPHYLSLVDIENPYKADAAIRDYIFYSEELVKEFGNIMAWEKEDIVEPGKPNVAGWILPTHHNIHRRYPEVAILIPDTVGRACGGLCVSCQRMYDFQNGHLNFNLNKLRPHEKWSDKLVKLMEYFENDAQLRDILVTGGDALMSSDKSLKTILDAIYEMALRKKEANKKRPDGAKYAEMKRVRLGTRLPVYIPQRLTDELASILYDFKKKASKIGIEQFVIQTHFESAMEITPEVKQGIQKLLEAGWIVTNQLVFTAAASRRGHTNKLRKILNDIGVLTYYTFSVKGFYENRHNFATNARAVQEQLEEKWAGLIPQSEKHTIKAFSRHPEAMYSNINNLRKSTGIPFLATDRNVLNMPGVGKSLTFRTIGITQDGRRILEFDHDGTRNHSPIIDKMGKVTIIESKSIVSLLKQFHEMGEELSEYESLFGYSVGETEERNPIYEYPEQESQITEQLTNLEV